jgi:hypothetical protein
MSTAVEDRYDPSSSLAERIQALIAQWAHVYDSPAWLVGLSMDIAEDIEEAVIRNTIDLDSLFGEEK